MLGKIKKAYQSIWKLNVVQEEQHQLLYLQQRNEMIDKYYVPLLKSPKYKEYLDELKGLLKVKDVEGVRFIRAGRHNDGGYIMLDDINEAKRAYSIGICDDVSWDTFMAEKGIDVYMYDHTIDMLPAGNDRFRWEKTGLAASDDDAGNLKSLKTLICENGHEDEKHMILKIDIEGCEWDVLSQISPDILQQFDQILMELHEIADINNKDKIIASLKNLNTNHQLVYVHANNNEAVLPLGDWNLPLALEVCYVNKDRYELKESERFFPTSLDERNNPSLPDIPLGFWT